jgi:quinol-cytochrome oxidoreductase complex cytochrome b subunit
MKHYQFTANEAIGYIRVARPGSVIGPQQHFLNDIQQKMFNLGDAMRRDVRMKVDGEKEKEFVTRKMGVSVFLFLFFFFFFIKLIINFLFFSQIVLPLL